MTSCFTQKINSCVKWAFSILLVMLICSFKVSLLHTALGEAERRSRAEKQNVNNYYKEAVELKCVLDSEDAHCLSCSHSSLWRGTEGVVLMLALSPHSFNRNSHFSSRDRRCACTVVCAALLSSCAGGCADLTPPTLAPTTCTFCRWGQCSSHVVMWVTADVLLSISVLKGKHLRDSCVWGREF